MGAKKKKSSDEPAAAPAPKRVIKVERDFWVFLEFKLLNWKYMNFRAKMKDSTYVFSIKKLLQERHGKLEDLRICFHSFSEPNEVKNDMLTLKECGIGGVIPESSISPEGKVVVDESNIPVVQVFYDFKPTSFDDPVLLFFNK